MPRRMLFVPNPHVRLDRAWAFPYVPLELLSAMAVAEQAGAEPALFDVNRLVQQGRLRVDASIWREAAALLLEVEPEVVLLETWTGTLHNTLQLAEQLAALAPRLPTVLVGAGTSALAREVLARFPFVEAVVRGEPEPAVEALAVAPLDAPPPAAPGLAHREGGQGVDAPVAWVADLDRLPRPAFHLALLQPGDTIPIEPGRGCEQGCAFCALAGHWVPRYRPREPEALAAEMVELQRRFPGSVLDLTQDPVFFNDAGRLARLCAALATANSGARWTCHARVDRLAGPQLEQLARAGCRGILFGVESGCPELQRSIGKAIDLERLEPTVAAAAGLGIEVRASFIVGLPGEDSAALGRTGRAMLRAREAGAADTPVQPLRAYPGAPIHREACQRPGALVPEPLLATAAPEDRVACELIAAHPDLLSASYRVDLCNLSRGQLLAGWLALSALPEALGALQRHGVDAARLLERLELDPVPDDLEQGVAQLARRIEEAVAQEGAALDRRSLHDLLRYQTALFAVGLEPAADGAELDEELLRRALADPAGVRPVTVAPWRLLELRTDVERLVDGALGPADHGETHRVLLAKVDASAGEASFYTRRSFAVETFQLDETGAALLELCDGGLDLRSIAFTVAVQLGRSPSATLEACGETAEELVRAGVLDLEG